jgi:hypothetical protein
VADPAPTDAAPGEPVPVHSVQEEYFHLMVRRCACGGPWASTDQTVEPSGNRLLHRVAVRCASCGRERTLRFVLPAGVRPDGPVPVREINPTAEPSRALDAAEWMDLARFYLERVGRLTSAREQAQSLLDARGCLEEALKFYGPEDGAPPPAALWSKASRDKVSEHPGTYRRATIEAMLAKIPSKDRLRQADAPEERELRKTLKEAARRRIGRRWWEFWKRGKN